MSAGLLVISLAALMALGDAMPSELFEDMDAVALGFNEERTFVNLNSTYIAYGVAAGAAVILFLAVGFYLYDYYYGTSRSDPVENPQVDYSQYYTDQQAYNQYLYEQAANNYRYYFKYY